jgi:hypothetical protein
MPAGFFVDFIMQGFDLDEWFLILDEEGEPVWPARINYRKEKGYSLEAIGFLDENSKKTRALLERNVIIGLLDYQRPATLINNFISKTSLGSIGVNIRCMREKYEVVVNGIIKNFHLTSLDRKCFIKISTQQPCFNAWLSPNLVGYDNEGDGDDWKPAVTIASPVVEKFDLKNGIELSINAFPVINTDSAGESINLRQAVSVQISLPNPESLSFIERIETSFQFLFGFLIAKRLEPLPVQIDTIDEISWNDRVEKIVAEAWYHPAWNRSPKFPASYERMFTRSNTPIPVEELI